MINEADTKSYVEYFLFCFRVEQVELPPSTILSECLEGFNPNTLKTPKIRTKREKRLHHRRLGITKNKQKNKWGMKKENRPGRISVLRHEWKTPDERKFQRLPQQPVMRVKCMDPAKKRKCSKRIQTHGKSVLIR